MKLEWQNIFKGAALGFAGTSFAKFVSFIVVPAYASALGPELFGQAEVLLFFASSSAILVSFEVFQFLAADFQKEGSSLGKNQRFRLILSCQPIWFCVSIFSSFVLARLTNFDNNGLLPYLLILLFVCSLSNMTFEYLRWKGSAKKYSTLMLIQSSIWFLVGFGQIAFELVSIQNYMLAVTCGHLPVVFFGGKLVFGQWRQLFLIFEPRWSLFCDFLIRLSPLVLAIYLQMCLHGLDRILLYLTGVDDELLGAVAISYRFAWGLSSLFLIACQITIQPLLINQILSLGSKGEDASSKAVAVFVTLVAFSTTGIMVFSELDILMKFFPDFGKMGDFLGLHFAAVCLLNIQIFRPHLILKRQYSSLILLSTIALSSMVVFYWFTGEPRFVMYIGSLVYVNCVLWFSSASRLLLLFVNLTLLVPLALL